MMQNKQILHPSKGMSRRDIILTCAAVLILIVILANAENWFGSYVVRILNTCCIYAIATLAMNLVNGCTGVFTLGNPGFMCVGAYTCALLYLQPAVKDTLYYVEPIVPWLRDIHTNYFIALICGGIMAALAAVFIGVPVLRLKGDYLSIATLGFSEIARIVMLNAQSVTNGAIGLTQIPNVVNIWVAFGALAVVFIFLRLLMNSSYGRAFLAIREDEIAAEAMGIHLFKHKMLSFVLSAFIAGISGGLLASLIGAIDANQFKYTFVYQFLLMMVLGGQGSMSGSVIGAFIVTNALEWLRFMDEPINLGFIQYPGFAGMRMVLFSVLLILIVLFWGKGIMGDKEFSWERLITGLKRLGKRRSQEKEEVS